MNLSLSQAGAGMVAPTGPLGHCFSPSGIGALSCEGIIALGTLALVIATIVLAGVSWFMMRAQVKETARAASEQTSVARDESKVRLILYYQDKYDSPQMIAHRGKLAVQVYDTSKRAHHRDILEAVPMFFESMGLVLREGHLDLNMVWNLFGNPAPLYWSALKGFVAEQRQEYAAYWSEFEYLVDECYKIEMARSGKSRAESEPSDFEVKEFLRAEILLARAEGTIPGIPS